MAANPFSKMLHERHAGKLIAAIREGDVDSVRRLADEKAGIVNWEDQYGNLPLSTAVCLGQTEIVQMLLERGADVNAESDTMHKAILLAAQSGNDRVEIVRLLLDKGADPNSVFKPVDLEEGRKSGISALHMAAAYGNPRIVQLLIDRGAKVNTVAKPKNHLPIHYAAACAEDNTQRAHAHKTAAVETLETLLRNGAAEDIDAADADGNRPAHLAVLNASTKALDTLVAWKANLGLANHQGEMPRDMTPCGTFRKQMEMGVALAVHDYIEKERLPRDPGRSAHTEKYLKQNKEGKNDQREGRDRR